LFRIARLAPAALLAAVTSVSLPVCAQLPLVAVEEEPTPPPERAPVEAVPPPVVAPAPRPPPTPPPLAPAKADAIGFGQHPYAYDDDADLAALAPKRTWYGWQTLLVDGASLSAVLLGAELDSRDSGLDGGVVTALGLLGYELGPGIVHFVHRNPGRGFASFGIRLGMPLAGAFLGASLGSNCDGHHCEEVGAAVGLLLGMAGAIVIDSALFAYDDRRSRATRATFRFVPLASLQPGRAWLGLGGEL
jgi:hypothetical protein